MVSTSCKGGRDSHGTVGSKGMKGASRIWVCVCVVCPLWVRVGGAWTCILHARTFFVLSWG